MGCVSPVEGLTRSAYCGKEVRRKEVCVELATLTAKGQVTVPKAVREALGLKRCFERGVDPVPLEIGQLSGVITGDFTTQGVKAYGF